MKFKHIVASIATAGILGTAAYLWNCPWQSKLKDFGPHTVKIATMNIQRLSTTKLRNKEVRSALVDIVTNFDVIAVQELQSESALSNLVAALNKTTKYKEIHGHMQGRGEYKEVYAILYRPPVQCSRFEEFVDTKDDFERDPLIGYFRVENFDFALVNAHIKPDKAKKEIPELTKVAQSITTEKDIILIGDFNADGSYYDEEAYTWFRWWGYTWIIPDSLDTTTSKSENTYDRMVISKPMREDYAKRFGVVRYEQALHIGNRKALRISDHYPVWALFRTDVDTD